VLDVRSVEAGLDPRRERQGIAILQRLAAKFIDIERQDYTARGRYVATVTGMHGIARLAYRREREDLIIAERTEISPQLAGLGVDLALIERMVEDARREQVKIYALCSYVEGERRSHPEWADVFYVPGETGRSARAE
jgi:predicted GNAT family acetyltransferase